LVSPNLKVGGTSLPRSPWMLRLCLHLKEREDMRKMIEEAKQVHIDNESEDVENYSFLVVGKGVAKKW